MVPPEAFSIRSARDGKLHRLTPFGDLDIATAPVLDAAISDALTFAETGSLIVLDLTALDFIDSSGVAVLVRAAEQVGAEDDRLRIVNGSPAVQRILDLSGLRSRLPVISPNDDPLAPLP
jgi:anti-anti-sigma factor